MKQSQGTGKWWEKQLRKANRHKRRFNDRNRHHLTPRSRGGGDSINNLLLIDIDKHKAWHDIFGVRTAEEVLALLERVVRAKKAQTSADQPAAFRNRRRAA